MNRGEGVIVQESKVCRNAEEGVLHRRVVRVMSRFSPAINFQLTSHRNVHDTAPIQYAQRSLQHLVLFLGDWGMDQKDQSMFRRDCWLYMSMRCNLLHTIPQPCLGLWSEGETLTSQDGIMPRAAAYSGKDLNEAHSTLCSTWRRSTKASILTNMRLASCFCDPAFIPIPL